MAMGLDGSPLQAKPSGAISTAAQPEGDALDTHDLLSRFEALIGHGAHRIDTLLVADAADLFEDISSTCTQAYSELDRSSTWVVNAILARIYRLHTTVPAPADLHRSAEGSYQVERIRRLIENAFLGYEASCVPPTVVRDMPADPDAFEQRLFDVILSHPAANHPLYTEFLPHRATDEDLRFLLLQESTIDAATDDFLALTQVGAPAAPKLEMAANYWDEMGKGDSSQLHSLLFADVIASLGISNAELENSLEAEALVCGNLQNMLSLSRSHFYKSIGYFAVVEWMTPARFTNLMMAWTRNRLDPSAAVYHTLHITVDTDHAQRWFRNVIAPVLRQSPSAASEITRGALYRLNTSQRYLDRIYPLLPSAVGSR